jgi:hypothetical protein
MYPLLVLAWKCSNVYIFWISVHYVTSHVYPYFCADLSFIGFAKSPFMVIAPHCKGLNWLHQTSTLAIENMWVILGTWIAAQLVPNPQLVAPATLASAPDAVGGAGTATIS